MHTEQYQKQLLRVHKRHPNWRSRNDRHVVFIGETFGSPIRTGKIKTILDYGCGKGELKQLLEQAFPDVSVTNYDPGVEEFQQLPTGKFDLVIATHVLEHVEPELLQDTLKELDSRIGNYAFFEVPHVPAGITLPDGRNAHLIIQPREWWLAEARKVWPDIEVVRPEKRCTALVLRRS
jgi:2-polyprenyl-3-methyl-5-hydroxy-6-metoxy-1,4-benzoquinol methylase